VSLTATAAQTLFRKKLISGSFIYVRQRHIDHNPDTHWRSERVSAVNGPSFFCTREGALEDPTPAKKCRTRDSLFYPSFIFATCPMIEK
jgi:hypothetical protein